MQPHSSPCSWQVNGLNGAGSCVVCDSDRRALLCGTCRAAPAAGAAPHLPPAMPALLLHRCATSACLLLDSINLGTHPPTRVWRPPAALLLGQQRAEELLPAAAAAPAVLPAVSGCGPLGMPAASRPVAAHVRHSLSCAAAYAVLHVCSTHAPAVHTHACQPCRGLRILFGDQTLFCRVEDFRQVLVCLVPVAALVLRRGEHALVSWQLPVCLLCRCSCSTPACAGQLAMPLLLANV